jgi:hypothetical protein
LGRNVSSLFLFNATLIGKLSIMSDPIEPMIDWDKFHPISITTYDYSYSIKHNPGRGGAVGSS